MRSAVHQVANDSVAQRLETVGDAEPLDEVPVGSEPELAREPAPHAQAAAAEASDAVSRTKELEASLQKARDAEAQLAREFRNYRRRAEADLASATSKAQVQLLAELAETVQALELAGSSADTDPASVRDGIALAARKLGRVFERHGLARIPAQGVAFDPTVHEAVFAEHVDGVVKGTIVREVSPGFRTEEEVILPAKVSVAA